MSRKNEAPRKKRWLPGFRTSILFFFYLGLAIWLQTANPTGDQGMANVLTMVLVLVALFTWIVWFLFWSGHIWWLRIAPLLGLALCAVLFSAFFRFEEVSGDMRPSIVPRSKAKSDRALATQPRRSTTAAVNLATTTEHDFSQFLGSQRNLRVDHITLSRDWSRPPQEVWRQPIGAGWAGFAVVNGYALTLEQRGDEEMVTCYDARTGELQWARGAATRFVSVVAGDGPRTTPTVDEGRVYALGATGRLWALDGATGAVIWEKDLRREYGMTDELELENFPYGRSNSPLVAGDLLVVPPGGPKERPVSLVAYDKRTGEKVWEVGDRQISCASPSLATVGGVEQVLIVNESSVSGHDPASGRLLWEHPREGATNATANVSQAVAVAPNRVFVSKGYGLGAALLELRPQGSGSFTVEEVWSAARVMRTKFTNVAIKDGYVYGLSDGILECIDLETGERKWKGGRYQHGQILLVGDVLLVLAESGELFMVEATPETRNHVLGSFKALDGKTWNNLALYGDLLLVRNGEEAAAYRLPLGA